MARPFVIGQWVRGERFYGRDRLIAEILEGPRDAIWLLGTRRIGKTSLLKQLEHLTSATRESGFFPLFWDLQGSDEPTELHLGFHDALLDAEERLEGIGLSAAEVEDGNLFSAMARLRRQLRPKGMRLLLLCDEVEELVKLNGKDPALLRKLRHAIQASEDVRAVLASTIRLWALAEQRDDTSPFLHGFTPPAYIGALTDEAARALLRQEGLPVAARPAIGEADLEVLRQRCDNHPYLLQLVGKRFLELGDLDRASDEVAADQMVSYFFAVDFDMLASGEQDILRSVARHSRVDSATIEASLELESGALQAALQNLANLGFIRRDAEYHIVLSNYFFRRWLTDLVPGAGSPTVRATATAAAGEVATGGETLAASSPYPVVDGRYELRRQVGAGATGIVYEAWDRLLETRIAVKLLRLEYAGNRTLLERFWQEILLSRYLGHPNILRVYHLGRSDDRPYLTMQWVNGPTLAHEIAEGAPFAAERVAFLGVRLASALEAAHGHGVLHRDIKPHNVLLDVGGEPLITDFGLARLLGAPGTTAAGVFLGTPNYVSPEQASLETLDERSDLYSLGVVLFEMATGRCPFRAESTGEVLELHRSESPPDPREFVGEIPAELADLILRCLEKDRDRRIATAPQLRRALESLLPDGKAPPHTAAVVSSLGLVAATADDPALAAEELMPLVYDELRRLARGFLARERPGHTLQPTALVHEAYIRLARESAQKATGRTHFFALGARIMRHLLIDHARAHGRLKRGGGAQRVTLQEGVTPDDGRDLDLDELLALDTALGELASRSPRQAAIVELRFFGGLTVEEVAAHLGVSKRTVESDWTAARGWLRRRLS